MEGGKLKIKEILKFSVSVYIITHERRKVFYDLSPYELLLVFSRFLAANLVDFEIRNRDFRLNRLQSQIVFAVRNVREGKLAQFIGFRFKTRELNR